MNRPFEDEWGHDPSVQSMRRVFCFMEEAQQQLLRDLNISLFDQRLRRGREHALKLFEQAWPLAIKEKAEPDFRNVLLRRTKAPQLPPGRKAPP